MSFAGFKKQINKANQFVSEKMGTAEGTKMDEEFTALEQKSDAISGFVSHVVPKTKEFLHPNPAVRAKMYINRDKGQPLETQEGEIGDLMLKASRELIVDCLETEYSAALKDVGCSLIEVSDSRNEMIYHVQENFLGPLIDLESKDLKDLAANMKKLQGRRLDFDCKKRKMNDMRHKGNKVALEQARQGTRLAEAKFDESTVLCKAKMSELLNNEVEMIHQLSQLVCALLEFHKKSADTLERSLLLLNKRAANAKNGTQGNGDASAKGTNPLADDSVTVSKPKPCCRAKADYQKQNDGELSFRVGDLIMLSSKIDNEWYEGVLDGKMGKIPAVNVRIVQPLPEKDGEEEEEDEEEGEEEEQEEEGQAEAEEEEKEEQKGEKKEEKKEEKEKKKEDKK